MRKGKEKYRTGEEIVAILIRIWKSCDQINKRIVIQKGIMDLYERRRWSRVTSTRFQAQQKRSEAEREIERLEERRTRFIMNRFPRWQHVCWFNGNMRVSTYAVCLVNDIDGWKLILEGKWDEHNSMPSCHKIYLEYDPNPQTKFL